MTIKLGQKAKTLVIKKMTMESDNIKQAQAIIPNIIHSLDGSHLMNIINTGKLEYKDMNIISVHDCFGSATRLY